MAHQIIYNAEVHNLQTILMCLIMVYRYYVRAKSLVKYFV